MATTFEDIKAEVGRKWNEATEYVENNREETIAGIIYTIGIAAVALVWYAAGKGTGYKHGLTDGYNIGVVSGYASALSDVMARHD